MLTPPAQYVVDELNEKTAVLLPVAVYHQLLEDLHDLAIVAQRREDTPIDLTDMLTRLGLHDVIHRDVHRSL